MIPFSKGLNSTVGRKYLMGISGLALVGFLVTHLIANLNLYRPTSDAFNKYTEMLHQWGIWLYAAELGLLGIAILHAAMAIKITLDNRAARPDRYAVNKSKGGPSKYSLASLNMIITGVVLLVFLVIHIWTFKYGPGVQEGYVTTLDNGMEVRDLQRLVMEKFQDPLYVVGYCAVMAFLWAHLRHGFWSSFQSLGAMAPRYSKLIHIASLVIAFLMAGGFFFIPIFAYFYSPSIQ
jgi:succinate dehydrogenase / fumarate reductase, cytochrome b subunit